MSQIRRFCSSARNLKIYRSFRALDIDKKTEIEYRIQEYPKDKIEEGIKFIPESFFKHEPMSRTRNFINKPEAVEAYFSNLRKAMESLPGKSLACFKENSDEIIAINFFAIKNEEQYMKELKFKSEDLNDIYGVISYVNKQFNPFKHYNVDHLLYAIAVGVKPAYRGRGIASEMFKCRRILCEEFGLKVTTTHATATGTQKAAAKAGFEENFVIKYSGLLKINPKKFNFPNIDTKFFKVMSLKV